MDVMHEMMMRDITLVLVFLCLAWLGLVRPWLGVLCLVVLSFMHPQGYTDGVMKEFPIYQAIFTVVTIGAVIQYIREKEVPSLPLDWRVFAILILWLWFLLTTVFSLAPWVAWDKFWQVLKILPTLALVLLLIESREKLGYLLITMALSILLVALKGGYWAIMTGFHDRVYGPPGSAYHDNNAFAVIVAMVIPLLMIWLRESRDTMLRMCIVVGMVLCYGSIISSWSRGGMLALAMVTVLLLLDSKRKYLAIPLLALVGVFFFIQLPEQWFGRMETFGALQVDQSTQGRLAVWKVGLENALQSPLVGTGFDAWPGLTLGLGNIDWHSMYVEMMAEHGFVGLAIWGVLLFGSILHLSWQASAGNSKRRPWWSRYATMLRASLAAYAVGGITLGITYWEPAYILITATVILSRLEVMEVPA